MSSKFAYVTLLTRAAYLPGALVLHQCLVSVKAKYPLVIMATPSLPEDVRAVVKKAGITLREVERLQPKDGTHSLAEHDARFGDTWTKLRCESSLPRSLSNFCSTHQNLDSRAFDLTEYEVRRYSCRYAEKDVHRAVS